MTTLLSVIAFLLLVIVLIMLFGREQVLLYLTIIFGVLIFCFVSVVAIMWARSL